MAQRLQMTITRQWHICSHTYRDSWIKAVNYWIMSKDTVRAQSICYTHICIDWVSLNACYNAKVMSIVNVLSAGIHTELTISKLLHSLCDFHDSLCNSDQRWGQYVFGFFIFLVCFFIFTHALFYWQKLQDMQYIGSSRVHTLQN